MCNVKLKALLRITERGKRKTTKKTSKSLCEKGICCRMMGDVCKPRGNKIIWLANCRNDAQGQKENTGLGRATSIAMLLKVMDCNFGKESFRQRCIPYILVLENTSLPPCGCES